MGARSKRDEQAKSERKLLWLENAKTKSETEPLCIYFPFDQRRERDSFNPGRLIVLGTWQPRPIQMVFLKMCQTGM